MWFDLAQIDFARQSGFVILTCTGWGEALTSHSRFFSFVVLPVLQAKYTSPGEHTRGNANTWPWRERQVGKEKRP